MGKGEGWNQCGGCWCCEKKVLQNRVKLHTWQVLVPAQAMNRFLLISLLHSKQSIAVVARIARDPCPKLQSLRRAYSFELKFRQGAICLGDKSVYREMCTYIYFNPTERLCFPRKRIDLISIKTSLCKIHRFNILARRATTRLYQKKCQWAMSRLCSLLSLAWSRILRMVGASEPPWTNESNIWSSRPPHKLCTELGSQRS